jgi:hypothetical protein
MSSEASQMNARLHADIFRNSSYVTGIISKVLEAVMLVLLFTGIFRHAVEMLQVARYSFVTIDIGVQVILTALPK